MVGGDLGSTLVALSGQLDDRQARVVTESTHDVTDRARIEHIFGAAIEAVRGERILRQGLRWEHAQSGERTAKRQLGRSAERGLLFERGGISLRLPAPTAGGRLRIIAIGKASVSMARGAVTALANAGTAPGFNDIEMPHCQGLVITKENAPIVCWPCADWQQIEGGHPVADARSVHAGETLLRFVAHSRREDRYLILLSGGASALAVQPVPGITLVEKSACVQALMAQGAPISALNLLRRHLSMIKGGGLARAIAPASHLTLAISDVPGDDPAVIGSAPTVEVPKDPMAVELMLKEFNLWQQWQAVLAPVLGSDPVLQVSEQAPLATPRYAVVASLDDAIEAAQVAAHEAELAPVNLGRVFYGDLSLHVAQFCEAIRACAAQCPTGGSLLIAAGEPTLRITGVGAGRGGRAQHFALACARALQGLRGVTVLAAGTDGTDGPTRVAGAVINGDSWRAIERAGVDAERCLREYDSYPALHAIGAHLHTGDTGTNVADLFLAVVHPVGRETSLG